MLPMAQMIAVPPLLIARAAAAAIALSIGLSFVGVWLQFRRAPMLAFATAWLVFGTYSSMSAFLVMGGGQSGDAFGLVFITLALLVGPAFLDAARVVSGPAAGRRRFGLVVGVAIVVAEASGYAAGAPTIAATACLLAAIVLVARAPAFAGQRGVLAGYSLLGLRFAASWGVGTLMMARLDEPSWLIGFTAFFMLCTILAGYFMIVAVFSVERDAAVRERVALERGLAQSQRMDSMGRMASSVAHDFNNILTAVLAASESVADDAAAPGEREDALADIRSAVERGSGLTRTLLDFATPSSEGLTDIDPVQRIAEIVPMVERLVGRQVQFTCSIAEELKAAPVTVSADPVQFDQLILNLAANARDAMPTGGPLDIRCDSLESPQVPGTSRVRSGPHLRVQVTDRGTGMPREVADRIFEPFFTTKAPGKGTGLGLSTAFGFVRHAHGEITVESEVGRGTTFTVLLPVRASAAPAPRPA